MQAPLFVSTRPTPYLLTFAEGPASYND